MPAAYLKAPEAIPTNRIPYWCAGRVRFESAVLAYQVASRRPDKHREHYVCSACGGFHLGTQHGATTSRKMTRELVRDGR